MSGNTRTIISSVIYNSKFNMGEKIIRRVLMIPYMVFLRYHLSNSRSINLIDSGRDRVGGLWDAL